MITAYMRTTAGVEVREVKLGESLPARTIWLDLDQCTNEELQHIEALSKLKLPELRELRHLDQRDQYYTEQGAFYAVSPIIIGGQTDFPRTGMIMFILTSSLLITLRQGPSQSVENFTALVIRQPAELDTPGSALTGLLQAMVNRLSDLSEVISHKMDQVSHLVFRDSTLSDKRNTVNSWNKVLHGLGQAARLNHRIISVTDGLEKVVLHLRPNLDKTQHRRLDIVSRSLLHLSGQSNSMVGEANFLLDAIVGAISIEQNVVIKIFSMVAVILMPPTMIASIYGMNFAHMPELNWTYGYPIALGLMVASGILPYWWFKRNGWF